MLAIDVSNVNGAVDWRKVAKAGIHLAFLKATEGMTFDDPLFARHRIEARKAGVHVGAYHFARPDLHDPISEARHFARVVGKLGAGELRPVLDFEHPAHLTPAQMERWARDWNHEVKRLTGVWPLFYSYPAFIDAMHLGRSVGMGLWLASYGPNDGREHSFKVPRPFRKTFAHQFTSNGRIPGVSGHVDISSVNTITPLLAHPVRGTVAHVAHNIARGTRGIFRD